MVFPSPGVLYCLAAPGAQVLKAGMTQMSLSRDLGAAPVLTAPRLLPVGLGQVLLGVPACVVSGTRSVPSSARFQGHRGTKAFRNGLSLSLLPHGCRAMLVPQMWQESLFLQLCFALPCPAALGASDSASEQTRDFRWVFQNHLSLLELAQGIFRVNSGIHLTQLQDFGVWSKTPCREIRIWSHSLSPG